jgi:hypothetical protein
MTWQLPERIKVRDEDGSVTEIEIDDTPIEGVIVDDELANLGPGASQLIGAARWYEDAADTEAEEGFLRPIK